MTQADAASLRPVLDRIARGERLSEADAEATFGKIMAGQATPAQIAGLLIGMRVRGESVGELVGAARALRRRMHAVQAPADALDVCGTGGDGGGTLNVSTAVAFVLAALGVPVAKHGNRGQSSRTGGTDVLAALGVAQIADAAALRRQLTRHGVAFFAAPLHHPALAHAAAVRSELGTRTLFNLLGPLCNPASVSRQLVGVFHADWLEPVATTLLRLGSERVWAVHGHDGFAPRPARGIDELSLAGPNQVVALEAGRLHRFTLMPEQLGFAPAPLSAISGGDAAHNAAALEAVLRGAPGAYRDTVLLNSAAALRVARGDNMFPPEHDVSGLALSLRREAARAAEAIDNGLAWRVLEALRADVGCGEEQD